MFAKPKRAVGVDLGSQSVKAVELVMTGARPVVSRAVKVVLDAVQMATDPMAAQVAALRSIMREIDPAETVFVSALSGQSVVIRYPRLPKMPPEEVAGAIEIEAAQNIPYEMNEITMDSVVLEEVMEDDQTLFKVLLVAARRELVEARLAVLQQAGINPHIISVDSLALSDAIEMAGALPQDESIALINIGATTTNIHFCRDGISSFIRDVSWGMGEVRTALQRAYRIEPAAAEQMIELATQRAAHAEAAAESSTPVPSSGGNPLDPLPGEGAVSGGSPLDPLPGETYADTSGSDSSETVGETPSEESLSESIRAVATRLVGEIRRSFDYYEQQLYERTVTRVILSGGGSEFPPLRKILEDELGVANIEVANPFSDRVMVENEELARDMLEHPAQFIVALGLAERGTSLL